MDDFDKALDDVVAAIRAHAAAVRGGGDVAAAIRAYDAVAQAYEEALGELDAEVPWFADPDDYDPDAEGDEGEAPPVTVAGERVAVRVRADFVVTDPDAVLAAGTAARRRVWEHDGEQPCTHLGEAMYEFVHEAGPVLPMFDVPGLSRANAVLTVHRSSGTVRSVDDLPVGEDDEQLFELVEEFEG